MYGFINGRWIVRLMFCCSALVLVYLFCCIFAVQCLFRCNLVNNFFHLLCLPCQLTVPVVHAQNDVPRQKLELTPKSTLEAKEGQSDRVDDKKFYFKSWLNK